MFEWVPQGTPIKYSNSLLVIEEKDMVRLVGDYRHVNKFIRPTSTTISPRLESFLDKMLGAKFYIKTDMSKGYWQLEAYSHKGGPLWQTLP